jgi:hypothetical protein
VPWHSRHLSTVHPNRVVEDPEKIQKRLVLHWYAWHVARAYTRDLGE